MGRYKISFVGAGRVGNALCRQLFLSGYDIDVIVSSSGKSSEKLADFCNARSSIDLKFPDSTDIIIVSVPDRVLSEVLRKIECRNDTLVAHTAGSYGLDVFPDSIIRNGVFYPVQTFSPGRNILFDKLPFIIESVDKNVTSVLNELAVSLGARIFHSDAEHRRILHLAAVFANNFTNHMLTLSKDVAIKAGFNLGILKPLIMETIEKAFDAGPENSQTGPAARYDLNTIQKHVDMLSDSPDLQRLYSELTESIINYYNKKPA
jgi:predicted short-subunit dehydrogenase-like oxidoreductase (DUF2520 family)